MEKVHRLISTCLGIGYTPKGGGTVAAAVCCIAWYLAGAGGNESVFIEVSVTAAILILGIWSAGKVEAEWGKDSSKVVIDEVAGMCLTLLFIPVKWQYVFTGLVLFRFFDIVKPLYIRRMEKLNGGWGVMLDDVLAGVYSNIVLQLIVLIGLWKA
ncbi:MAG: phosphatidylglycerophosphatase A [Chitinophagaceae bacterium]|nr:phosphatidylglycerophosphatase A [Chitinophagaceae bacterium]